ncbi:hypothetical protein GCM10010228_58560 [Streptomyces massasporeus]|nr:hypothetical protein GCM10010228_58560 [Streptomyces massasporeus]
MAALSLAVMPFRSAAQRRTGRELGSASTVADSKQTLLCTCPPAASRDDADVCGCRPGCTCPL